MTPRKPVREYPELVGYDYFAKELGVSIRTIYAYASGTSASRLEDFPKPAPLPSRTPLFIRAEADEFIQRRKAGSSTGKGRVRATELTTEQRAAAEEASSLLGHEIDLENRKQLREAIYGELELPVLTTTKELGEPAITHAALKKLYKRTGNPFLFQVLIYRGIPVKHIDAAS